jgi:hypothetical protein
MLCVKNSSLGAIIAEAAQERFCGELGGAACLDRSLDTRISQEDEQIAGVLLGAVEADLITAHIPKC